MTSDPTGETTSRAPEDDPGDRRHHRTGSAGAGPRIPLVAGLVAAGGIALAAVAGTALLDDRGSADTDGPETTEGADPDDWAGVLLGEPRTRPDFVLTDIDTGEPFDFREETAGGLTLLFFGYTNCPDVCPIHMATLAGALDQPGMPRPTVVFVTTDPDRDTPERLRSFLDTFDHRFIGLTGTADEIAAAEQAAGVAGSMRIPDESADEDGDYEIGHSTEVVAYTADDLAHVTYPFGVRRQDWMDDLPRLLERFPASGVEVTDAWGSVTVDTVGAYVTIENPGPADRLVGVESPDAAGVGLMHETGAPGGHDGAHSSAVDLPTGTTALEPGVAHIMVEDLDRTVGPGDTVTLELHFETAPLLTVEVEILDWDEVVERRDAA